VSVRFKGSRAISAESGWWGRADWSRAALVEIQHSNKMEWSLKITTPHSENVPETTSTSVLEIQLVLIVQYEILRQVTHWDVPKAVVCVVHDAFRFQLLLRLLRQQANPRWYTFCD
jgi:hypothetical protein